MSLSPLVMKCARVCVCVYVLRSVAFPRKREGDLTSLRKAGLEGRKEMERLDL